MRERQEINTARKRNDPAVEERLRGHLLAAEVIDHENAVVGLHLQRSPVHTRRWISFQFELFTGELTTNDDARTQAKHPTSVKAFRLRGDRLMDRWIENGDDRLIKFDRSRYEDGILVHLDHAFREAGLTGAGRPVQEDRTFRDEGWTQFVEEPGRDDEVVEGFLQGRGIDRRSTTLTVDGCGVDV